MRAVIARTPRTLTQMLKTRKVALETMTGETKIIKKEVNQAAQTSQSLTNRTQICNRVALMMNPHLMRVDRARKIINRANLMAIVILMILQITMIFKVKTMSSTGKTMIIINLIIDIFVSIN